MNNGIGTRHGKAGIVFFFLLACVAFALWAPNAEAVSGYFSSFQSTYPNSPLSAVSSNCSICHTAVPTRNSYGTAYGNNGHNFAAIETQDSDGDGFTNIAEINAGTYPGNSSSVPAATNTAPVAANDSYSVAAGSTLTVGAAAGVLANDTDAQGTALTAAVVTAPATGTFSLASNGSFTYTPTISSGSVTFTYRASDGSLNSNTATVTITVTAAGVTGEVTVMPAEGAVDVPVNTVVTATLTGAGSITTTFNAQTFTLRVNGPEPPESSCVDDGIMKGAISYNASNTAGTFTPACPLTNGTAYTATIASSTGGLSAAKTWEFTTIAASPDTDEDGVPDNEDDHPGNRGRGTPPSSRGHGKFLVDVTDTAGASLAFAEGMAETNASLNPAGMPAGYEFPDGLVSYQVIGVAPGGTATVKITFPSGIPAGSKVYKVGTAGFQEFAGATIQGNTVTLTLTDGGAGDRDGLVNGIIVDPIGVAVPTATGTGAIDLASGAGGGCSVAGRTGSGGSNIDVALILAGLGLSVWGIRIRRRRE
jgi:VCBS repeat-containing protein